MSDLSANVSWGRRTRGWISRYGPAELVGVVTAFLGSALLRAFTGSEIAAAYGGMLGENLGFYSVIILRELKQDDDIAPVRGASSRARRAKRMARNILLEFGPAEVLDSTIVRPLTMGLATSYLGREWGVPLGKVISDLIFYVIAALAHERWRRHLIDPTDTVSVEPQ